MTPVAEIYDDLLKQIGPLGVTAYSCSWLYQLTPSKQIRIISGKEIAVEITNTEIRFHIHPWYTRGGSLLFWSRVCNQRVDGHAQLAAQELGRLIAGIVEPLYPVSWKALCA